MLDYNEDEWVCENSVPSKVECTMEQLTGGASSLLLLDLDRIVASDLVWAEVSSKTPDDILARVTAVRLRTDKCTCFFLYS